MSPSSTQEQGRRKRARVLAFLTVIAAAVALFYSTGAANATTVPTTVTATTQISNHPDNGHGGFWAYLDFKRTLVVTKSADQTGVAEGSVKYDATITDDGTFTTILGALAPNQSTAGVKISNSVNGLVHGTYALTVTAPATDTLTRIVPPTEDDNFAASTVSTTNWPTLVFADPTQAVVKAGSYDWEYQTVPPACSEHWSDTSANSDGNLAADGNVTGKLCPVPYVYHGQVVAVSYTGGVVGWNESKLGWPDSTSKCEEVWISGYGFGAWDPNNPTNPGTAHIGFTCDHSGNDYNQGYLRGLTKGHKYALRIVPAVGSYGTGNNHPIPGAHVAYVDVFTPAA